MVDITASTPVPSASLRASSVSQLPNSPFLEELFLWPSFPEGLLDTGHSNLMASGKLSVVFP